MYNKKFIAHDFCGLPNNANVFEKTTGSGNIVLYRDNHVELIETKIFWYNHLIKISSKKFFHGCGRLLQGKTKHFIKPQKK